MRNVRHIILAVLLVLGTFSLGIAQDVNPRLIFKPLVEGPYYEGQQIVADVVLESKKRLPQFNMTQRGFEVDNFLVKKMSLASFAMKEKQVDGHIQKAIYRLSLVPIRSGELDLPEIEISYVHPETRQMALLTSDQKITIQKVPTSSSKLVNVGPVDLKVHCESGRFNTGDVIPILVRIKANHYASSVEAPVITASDDFKLLRKVVLSERNIEQWDKFVSEITWEYQVTFSKPGDKKIKVMSNCWLPAEGKFKPSEDEISLRITGSAVTTIASGGDPEVDEVSEESILLFERMNQGRRLSSKWLYYGLFLCLLVAMIAYYIYQWLLYRKSQKNIRNFLLDLKRQQSQLTASEIYAHIRCFMSLKVHKNEQLIGQQDLLSTKKKGHKLYDLWQACESYLFSKKVVQEPAMSSKSLYDLLKSAK